MSSVEVIPVSTRRHRKQFTNLVWELYRGDPHWIPPLRGDFAERVGFRHSPFWDEAEGQAFLALKDGRPCGRVSAIINHAHNRRHEERRGFFGFFDAIDDQSVADALFEAARLWLAERNIENMRGPVNPSMNYECGLLIDGFDSPPTFMMTYNWPYYARLIENFGFRKSVDMYAFWGHIDMIETLDDKLKFICDECIRRFDIKLRTFNPRRFHEEVRLFMDIYNRACEGMWGFVPLSEGEIDHMAHGLRYLIDPDVTSVAEVDGKPVAAVFGMLDFNPRIKKIDGRLFPFGFLRLLYNKKKIKRVRLISTNVIPEYQRWGLGLVIHSRLLPQFFKRGVEEGEFSWVLENNKLSRSTLTKGGAKLTKTYRMYEFGADPT